MSLIGKNWLSEMAASADSQKNGAQPQPVATVEAPEKQMEQPKESEVSPARETVPSDTKPGSEADIGQKVETPQTTAPPDHGGESPAKESPKPDAPKPKPIDDNAVLAYLKEKSGQELASLEDLLKKPDPVDPYRGLDERTVQYLKYNQETGRSYDDFQKLERDYSKMSPLQAARAKAIDFSDGELTLADVDDFLENELGIDLAEKDKLDKFDAIKLKGYGRDYIERQIADQEKYRKPIERPEQQHSPEMVTLDNGMAMPKTSYEKMQNERQRYVESIRNATDNITGSKFTIKLDDRGTEKAYDIGYDYSKEDKHRMVSGSIDVNKMVHEVSGSEKGGIDHAKHAENTWWYTPENRERAIGSIAKKLWAEWTEEFTKMRTNANFDTTKRMPASQNGSNNIPVPGLDNYYGVKFPLEQFKT